MHAMPYEDDSFDLVIAGWVLVYSSDPDQACREMLRVVRDGGIIAIGATRVAGEKRDKISLGRTDKHYPVADDLLSVFGSAVDNVYVKHNGDTTQDESRTIVIFDVKK